METGSRLGRVELLSGLRPAELQQLEAWANPKRYRRGEAIFTPGDASVSLYLIRKGRVKISRLSPDGREITLHILEPGEPFGEEALVDDESRYSTAQALDETHLLELPAAPLREFLAVNAELANAVLRLMCRRRRLLESQVEELAFKDVGARLASCLLSLAASHGIPLPSGDVLIRMRLTHQELAHLVCTTRETITLTLDRFKQEGWLASQGRMLVLCDRDALQRRAMG
jgi:CRP/FNR family transcriptional regulator, cyclic AMP receptor protein